MNFKNICDIIFNVFSILMLIMLSVVISSLTFSFFFFPLTYALFITIQNNIFKNKGYFLKTYFNSFIYILKKYFSLTCIYYIILLVLSYFLYFSYVNIVPIFFNISFLFTSSIFYLIILYSTIVCKIEVIKLAPLIYKSVYLMKKHINFSATILAITYGLIYIFFKTNIILFVILFIVYIFLISFILEYAIVVNYEEELEED